MRKTTCMAVVAVLLTIGTAGLAGPAGGAPTAAPSSGVNDWNCRPSEDRPNPVLLLHGLGAPSDGHWSYLAPHLAGQGYCVYYFTYGKVSPFIPLGGFRPIDDSAHEIAGFIDRMRAATGADEVDVVGHSEGGFLSLYVPKVLDYGDRVGTVVSLAPPTHGTTFAGLVGLADGLGLRPVVDLVLRTFGCDACSDLIIGGPAVDTLTDGPIAVPGVDYTVIATRFDALVTPTDTSFVPEPGVDNRYVQDECPHNPVGHVGMAFDSSVATMITNALTPEEARPVRCTIGLPF